MENLVKISSIDDYKLELVNSMAGLSSVYLREIAHNIVTCKGTIYILGNGGSLSTATHFAVDISKNTGKPIRTDTLTELPKVTAYANDSGYDLIYQLQLFSKLRPDDIIFNISTSGNSKNLVNATLFARDQGNMIISLLGYGGGILKGLSDYYLIIPSRNVRIVEDVHSVACHILTQLIEEGSVKW